MEKEIKPLWRKMNKEKSYKTHNLKVGASYDRGKKDGIRRSMTTRKNHQKDYTPLYNYLLKNVGKDFDELCSKIYPRIDDRDRIFDIIQESKDDDRDLHRVGEATYYNTLFVDENNKLQIKNPNLRIEHLYPSCDCCTHTLNGKVFTNKWVFGKDLNKTY